MGNLNNARVYILNSKNEKKHGIILSDECTRKNDKCYVAVRFGDIVYSVPLEEIHRGE